MGWLIPLLTIGASLIGQNVQNKAAIKNNENQQAAQQANNQAAIDQAKGIISPFLAPNAAPFANATSKIGPMPSGPTQGPAFAQQVMGVNNGAYSAPQTLPGTQMLRPPQPQPVNPYTIPQPQRRVSDLPGQRFSGTPVFNNGFPRLRFEDLLGGMGGGGRMAF